MNTMERMQKVMKENDVTLDNLKAIKVLGLKCLTTDGRLKEFDKENPVYPGFLALLDESVSVLVWRFLDDFEKSEYADVAFYLGRYVENWFSGSKIAGDKIHNLAQEIADRVLPLTGFEAEDEGEV